MVASPTSCGIGNEAMVRCAAAVSTYATAEFVVPRSMPTMNRGAMSGESVLRAHVELELPAPLLVAADAPQLQHPDFVDAGLQVHRHGRALVAFPVEGRGQRR